MNLSFSLKRTTFLFLLVCFVVSFGFVQADRTIRLRKAKTSLAPKHIALSARSGSGIYARRYSYGRPIPNYNTKPVFGRNRRNYNGRRTRKRENGSRTYASGYRNWTPNRNLPGGRKNPRIDNARLGPYKKRKEPYPFVKEPHYGSTKQKRRIRPNRFGPVQRPLKHQNDFDDEYYFRDETKRGEKYDFESRYPRPKKKRRNPSTIDKIPKKPELVSKIPYYDDKFYKPKREPPVSFSTFIQHPLSGHDEADEVYEDPDADQYTQPVIVKSKKKRVKKKTSSKKKNKNEAFYRPFVFEDPKPELYSPYQGADEYELPGKTKKTSKPKPGYEAAGDEDFAHNKNVLYTKPKPASNLFSTSDSDFDYRGSSKDQDTYHSFSPSYSPSWSTVVETTARPVQYQTEHGFQPQQYKYQNRDYSSSQKKTVTTNSQQSSSYYSQPDNTYKNTAYSSNYVGNQVSSANTQTPVTNFNYHAYSNSVYSSQPSATLYSQQPSATLYSQQPSATLYSQQSSPTVYSQQSSPTVYSSQSSPTYSQPAPSNFAPDVTIQKSVPIYDNTETFYSFNNNAYVNNQASKYYDPDSQKYSTRVSTTYRNNGEKSDDEFVKKHQNLYNNGLSGVPVQGDGFGKDSAKKDYDIGFGDFQFDENPTT